MFIQFFSSLFWVYVDGNSVYKAIQTELTNLELNNIQSNQQTLLLKMIGSTVLETPSHYYTHSSNSIQILTRPSSLFHI